MILKLILLALLTMTATAFAKAPMEFTVDGQLFQAGTNTPLQDSSVRITAQILSADGHCILYEETVSNIDTRASQGAFTLRVGSDPGNSKRSGNDSGTSMPEIFQNSHSVAGVSAPGKNCAGGASVAAAGSPRLLRLIVTPSATQVADTLSPDMVLDSVPNALVAETLNGLGKDDLLQVNSTAPADLTQSSLESLFNATRLPALQSLADGSSSLYMGSSANGGASLPSYSGAPSSPAPGSVWYDSASGQIKYYNGSTQVVGTSGAGLSSLSTTSDLTANGTAGGTLNAAGQIGLATTGVTAGDYVKVSVDNKGRVIGTPSFTDADLPTISTPGKVSGNAITSGTIGGSTSILTSGTVTANAMSTNTLVLNDAGSPTPKTFTVKAAASLPANLSWTLPASNGAGGQLLSTNGSGVLSWTTPKYTDLANSFGGTPWPTVSCPSGHFVIWQSSTDSFVCSALTSGQVTAALGFTPANSASLSDYVAKAGDTMTGVLNLPANGLAVGTNQLVAIGGNVGIGTASPQSALHLHSATSTGLRLGTSNSNYGGMLYANFNAADAMGLCVGDMSSGCSGIQRVLQIFNNGSAMQFGNYSGTSFWSGFNVERMRITGAGNVGIGTTNPTEKLQVAGAIKVTGVNANITPSAAAFDYVTGGARIVSYGPDAATNGSFYLYSGRGDGSNGNYPLVVTSSGKVGIGTSSPSAALHVNKVTPAGTISSSGTSVLGAGTNFDSAFSVGDFIVASNQVKTITAIADATNMTVNSAFSSDLPVATTYARVGTVINTGHVGIGTTTPYAALSVAAPQPSAKIILTNTSGPTVSSMSMSAGQNESAIYFADNIPLQFRSASKSTIDSGTYGGTERMRITPAGDVGIGTSNPQATLDVNGVIRATQICDRTGANCKTISSGWGAGGTVTSITAGTGLTGGTITTTGTIGLDTELTGLNALGTTGFVKRTGAGAYSTSATLNLATDVNGVLPIANGGTNSGTALNNDRLMYSTAGAIKEMGAMTDGQLLVGKASSPPQIVTMAGDATISNTGSLTIATGAVTSAKILDGTIAPADMSFAGSMATNTGLLVRNATQFYNMTCSGNQALTWSVANGWICSNVVLTETDPKIGTNTTNSLSKWDGTQLVASGVFENGGNVGIGTTNPQASLDVGSKTDAVALPKGTTAQQPGSPSMGWLRFNTTKGVPEVYNGTAWMSFGTAVSPAGMVAAFPTSTCPSGWLEANGGAVSRTTYASLFVALSTTYGAGDGSTTFNLPDYRGYFLRGWAHGSTNDPDRATRTDRGDGTNGDNVGTKQAGQYEAHTHTATDGGYAIKIRDVAGGPGGAYGEIGRSDAGGSATADRPLTIGTSGGNETRPKNVSVIYCVSTQTISPTTIANSGSGTANYLPQWTSSTALGDSPVATSGGNVGIGTTSPAAPLEVNGTIRVDQICDRSGTNCKTISSGWGGLTNFSESANSSAPNATVPVVRLLATNAATNVDIALTPKGTGSILAHVPDSTATGGNKRGNYAVDLQTSRLSASQVASGATSVLVGGDRNTASGTASVVVGGAVNTASNSWATVAGGSVNTASGTSSFVGGGDGNTASGSRAAVVGATNSTASGDYSFVSNYRTTADAYAQTTFGAYNMPKGSENATSWVTTDPLFVVGNGTGVGPSRSTAFMILKNGNVGIGTTAPAAPLDINGDFAMRGIAAPAVSAPGQGRIYFDSTTNKFRISQNGAAYSDLASAGGGAPGGSNAQIQFNNAGSFGANANFVWDNSTLRLGIGTTSPSATLDVAGKIAFSASGTPTISNCGAGGKSISGNDSRGQVTAGNSATGCTVTFNTPYQTPPICVVSGALSSPGVYMFVTSTSTTEMVVGFSAAANKTFNYICVQ